MDNQLTFEAIAIPYSSAATAITGSIPYGLPRNGPSFADDGPAQRPLQRPGPQVPGSSTNVMAKWSSAFNNKRILWDTSIGWFHGTGGRSAADGSSIGGASGFASIPNVWWQGDHSITDFEAVPDPTLCAAASVMGTRCPVNDYHTGGSEFIDEQKFNRYQARTVVTGFVEGLGHHVIKAGVDTSLDTFDHLKGYAGGAISSRSPRSRSTSRADNTDTSPGPIPRSSFPPSTPRPNRSWPGDSFKIVGACSTG